MKLEPIEVHRKAYTIPEVAQIMGVSRSLAYDMARKGMFPIKRLLGRVVAPMEAFDRWLNEWEGKAS